MAVPGLSMLREMIRIRCVEEVLADLYRDEQEMRTPTHFSIGQEAAAVGVMRALQPGDAVYSGHRCHAQYLAKGGDLLGMVAELYGKERGCSRGRGGSVHLNDFGTGFAAAAILGEMIAVGVGAAWAFSMGATSRIAVAFFGDGATEEGVFHESMNFAMVRRVPCLFVCENNLYSLDSPIHARQPGGTTITARARSYGMPALAVDGNDVFAIYSAAGEAADWCRRGKGPYFLELQTYRWREHVGPNWDYGVGTRSKAEVGYWMERCPIRRAADALRRTDPDVDNKVITWEAESRAEISEAVGIAKASPFPDVAALFEGAYES